MTIEEKAKAYDEALERARKELKQDLHESGVWAIQRIFPELKESEEEQALRIIRKRMRYDPAPISDEDRRFVENWLEKRQVLQSTEADESTKRLNDNWMKQHFDDYEEQKPAERSEEDRRILRRIIERLSVDKNISLSEFKEMQTFLDSYRQ